MFNSLIFICWYLWVKA